MARAARSVVADRIRIEDEVWEEAFASRVRSRRPRTRQPLAAVDPEAPVGPIEAPVRLRSSEAPVRLHEAPPPPLNHPSASGRRTVRIQGRGAERNLPPARPRARRAHESAYFRPDRLAMWAVVLGLVLVLAAMVSGH